MPAKPPTNPTEPDPKSPNRLETANKKTHHNWSHSQTRKTKTAHRTILFFLIFVFNSARANQCGLGCLRCDQNSDTCLLCDFQNFFFFDFQSQMCLQKKMSNCVLAFVEGDCLLCANNRHPSKRETALRDSSVYLGNACVPNVDSVKVSNCDLFYSQGKCARCKKGHFLKVENNVHACVKGKAEHPFCIAHQEDGCLACRIGFELDPLSKTCSVIKYPSDASNGVDDDAPNKMCISPNIPFGCDPDSQCTDHRPDINLNFLLQSSILNKRDGLLRQVLRFKALEELGLLYVSPFMTYYSKIERVFSRKSKQINDANYLNIGVVDHPWKADHLMIQYPERNFVMNRKAGVFSLVQLLFPFCLKVDPNSLECVQCVKGYFLHPGDKRCMDMRSVVVANPSCLIWENVDRCFECADGYVLGDDKRCRLRAAGLDAASDVVDEEPVVVMKIVSINGGGLDQPEEGTNVDNVKQSNGNGASDQKDRIDEEAQSQNVSGNVQEMEEDGNDSIDPEIEEKSQKNDTIVDDKEDVNNTTKSTESTNTTTNTNTNNNSNNQIIIPVSNDTGQPNIIEENEPQNPTTNTQTTINQNSQENPSPQQPEEQEIEIIQEPQQVIIDPLPDPTQIDRFDEKVEPTILIDNTLPNSGDLQIENDDLVSTSSDGKSKEISGKGNAIEEASSVLNESFQAEEGKAKKEENNSTIRVPESDSFAPSKKKKSQEENPDSDTKENENVQPVVVVVDDDGRNREEEIEEVEKEIKSIDNVIRETENESPKDEIVLVPDRETKTANDTNVQPNETQIIRPIINPTETNQPQNNQEKVENDDPTPDQTNTPQSTPTSTTPNDQEIEPNSESSPFIEPPPESKLLTHFNLGPVRNTKVEGLTLVNEQGEELPYPQNKKYIIRRRYENPVNFESMEREFIIVYTMGNIIMAYDLNRELSTTQLSQFNITQNCVEVLLKEDEEHPLASCVKCVDPEQYVLTEMDNFERQVKLCRPRLRKIQNCAKYVHDQEECAQCGENHFLYINENQQKCLKTINGCKTTGILDKNLICSECRQGLFLENERCKDQNFTIPNCKVPENGNCLICDEGHFLYGNSCVTSLVYNFFFCPLTETNFCDCGSRAIELDSVDECVSVGQDNCVQYSGSALNLCQKCRNGFYLNEEIRCIQGEIPFCLEYGDNIAGTQVCAQCQDGYVLENNTCRKTLAIFSENCLEARGEQCLKCSDETFRLTFAERSKTLSVCAENVFFGSQEKIKNCLVFDQDLGVCEKCLPPLFVDETGACNTCDLKTHGIDNFNQKCVRKENLLRGCELYDENFCVKCRDGLGPSIINENEYTVAMRQYTNVEKNEFTQKPSYVINRCGVKLSKRCETEHCAHAVKLNDQVTCCFKCMPGRTGVWSHQYEKFFTANCDTEVEFCNLDSKIKGIPINYHKYLTCQECVDDKIIHLNLLEDETQIQCIDPPPEIPETQNCLILVEKECRICKPGFFQTLPEDSDRIVCSPIQNCEFSETVEQCERCSIGFALSPGGVECVSSPIEGCKEVDDQLTCVECRDGMLLNQGRCFKLDMPGCLKFDGENCASCDLKSSGETFRNVLIRVIFESSSILNQPKKTMCLRPDPSRPTVDNCKVYDTPFYCRQCQSNFILQQNSPIDSNTRGCVQDPQTTLNCEVIGPQKKCIKCRDSFFLQGDRCVGGNIQGCKTYADELNCAECDKKYTKLLANGRELCYISHEIEKCDVTNFEVLFNGKLSLGCSKCQDLFKRQKVGVSNKLCFPLRVMPHCKVYDSDSGQCRECDDLYFLNPTQTQCIQRQTLNIKNCQKFDPRNDTCLQCGDDLVFNQTTGKCETPQIEKLANCLVQQKGKFECLVCERDHALNASLECQKVFPIIANCAEYSSFTNCRLCDAGFTRKETGGCRQVDDRPTSSFQGVATSVRREGALGSSVNMGVKLETNGTQKKANSPQSDTEKELNELEANLLPGNNDEAFTLEVQKVIENDQNGAENITNSPESLRVLQGELLDIESTKSKLVDSVSDQATQAILGKDSNPIVKAVVKNQVSKDMNNMVKDVMSQDFSQKTEEEISKGIKNTKKDLIPNLNNLSDEHTDHLKNVLSNLNMDGKIGLPGKAETQSNGDGQKNQVLVESEGEAPIKSESITLTEVKPETNKPQKAQNESQITASTKQRDNRNQSASTDMNKITLIYNDPNAKSKSSQKSAMCGLCKFNYSWSGQSQQCTKLIVPGCLVVNKERDPQVSLDVYRPCLVCMPGYSHVVTGACIKNMVKSGWIVEVVLMLWVAVMVM